MEPFRYHIFVCTQQKPEGVTCCSASGAGKLLESLYCELGRAGLEREVQVSSCGCLGLCDGGPVMITYPDGVWYSKVLPEDAPELVRSHFQHGQPVTRLLRTDSAGMKAEIL
ncbi:MAG TPA: (2Fe-2S) ferredoxin domain-containing protein, partial [Terriglobales bacterium]|nr:(2Fe-2S) ferredoxin domain-containing protein [Terriglobales bacterium]